MLNDAKQNAVFVQLWDWTRQYSALCRTSLRTLAGVDAIAAIAAELSRDGAGRTPKFVSNLTHGELLKMEAIESHALFRLDLFVVLEWSDLHLRTLQGLQVLYFTFESAHL